MIILFHDIGMPPLWVIVVIAVLWLASYPLILYGAIFLVRNWKKFDTALKVLVCLVLLIIFAFGPVVGYLGAVPFGVLASIPVMFFFDTSDFWVSTVLGYVGCLLNALGVSGVIALLAKKMGLT